MLRKSIIYMSKISPSVTSRDQQIVKTIASYVVVQCILVYCGAASVLLCAWNPDYCHYEWEKIARVMYLFDATACHYRLRMEHGLAVIHLSNDTHGYKQVFAIRWAPAMVTVTQKWSATYRQHMYSSIGFHIVWMFTTIPLFIFYRTRLINHTKIVKYAIQVFLTMSIVMVLFDVSMAVVYIVHIQKSISKGMVLRQAGWSANIIVKDEDSFAGWLVMAASACWLRGIIFTSLNIYCCKVINKVRKRMITKEVKKRMMREGNLPFPDTLAHIEPDNRMIIFRREEK